ncbi:hypothetical protein PC121_g24057, partial [Phytophthora cactorum]
FEDEKWPFGCEGGPEDIVTPSGVGSAEVSKLLARADGEADEFSFGGVADPLPVAPGLFVDGLGFVSTPLYAEQAEKLIALCEKSPFGHNMDTKRDDNVRKSWQLEPNLIEFKNPLWKNGIEGLSKVIADRLGYKDIPLKCVPYKLLVYGEGGHFVKHQDTEKEEGMITTLVVQPPSTHEGGDLVLYRDGEVKYRHDFGKLDVTKGYRLALVAISKMDGDDDSFALLLAHEYTENSIRNMGSGALKGVDSARFHALDGANALVPEDKKLLFFIVQLQHDVSYSDDGYTCEKDDHNDSITWFTRTGEGLGRVGNSTEMVNFLNPGQEDFESLWDFRTYGKTTKEGGYVGNEGSTRVSTYTRYAIVAWSTAKHPENALKYMPVDAAVEALHCHKPVSAEELGQFLNGASAKIEAENKVKEYGEEREVFSMKFFRLVCELLAETGDPKVVNSFFTSYCGALSGVEDNETFIPSVTTIDKNLFETIAKKFRVAETSLLGPSIQYVWQYLSNNGNEEKRAMLDSVVPLRVKWLEDQIEAMDKTFSWEMPDADFSPNEKIQAFLRGPEQSMTTKGVKTFKSFQEAKNYAAKYMPKERDDCSFEMEAAEVDGDAFVTITKTRDWF